MGMTLYDKLWTEHIVRVEEDGTTLLYIDRHLLHEVSSPQAFEGIKIVGHKVRRPDASFAVPDHNVPTTSRADGIADILAKEQIDALMYNSRLHGIPHFKMNDREQGIVHVVGPEQGIVLPGMTVVCGDSHTSTHGALAALGQGIGTSDVEHVLATQTLVAKKAKNMLIRIDGAPQKGVSAKDIALAVIGKIGTGGATGYTIEYVGSTVRGLTIEARMTLCNMAIEAGARNGLVAFDEVTFNYVRSRPQAPQGDDLLRASEYWKSLYSDGDAHFDKVIEINGAEITPQVTWGTSPEMVIGINESVPIPDSEIDIKKRESMSRALTYMDLRPNLPATDIYIDRVFIGSCTNSRIEDLRAAASVIQKLNGRIAANVKQALVVPGSGLVKAQAEQEGLHAIFLSAGFEWREPGCSMCLAMNADKLEAGERCASTSNRNFEGRQGAGGRTHLVSPEMAAAAAIVGRFIDVRLLWA